MTVHYIVSLNANHQLADGMNVFRSIPVQSSLPNGISAILLLWVKDILVSYKCLYNILFGANSEGQLRRFNHHISYYIHRNTLESKQLNF